MKYLGLDYGEVKIGLAVSEGEIATPQGVLEHGQYKALALYCQENKVEKIIIGLSENKMAEKTREFGEKLAKETGLPIEYQDETLTSKMATKKMVESEKARRRRKTDEHSFSAALILQGWLDNF